MVKALDRAIREGVFQRMVDRFGFDPRSASRTCEIVAHMLAVTGFLIFGAKVMADPAMPVVVTFALFGASVPLHQANVALQCHLPRIGHATDDVWSNVARLCLFASTAVNIMLYVVLAGMIETPLARFAIFAAIAAMPSGLAAAYLAACRKAPPGGK